MPLKVSSSLPQALQMKLRPNRAAAPGKSDIPVPKRPSAVVTAEKKEKQHAKEVKQTALNDRIKALSKLEDEMAKQDKENNLKVNHPPISTKPKVTRKRGNVAVAAGEKPQSSRAIADM
jgi:hypothetical protein